MNEHLKIHGHEKKEEVDRLKCRYCQLLFNSQGEFKKHMSEHSKVSMFYLKLRLSRNTFIYLSVKIKINLDEKYFTLIS